MPVSIVGLVYKLSLQFTKCAIKWLLIISVRVLADGGKGKEGSTARLVWYYTTCVVHKFSFFLGIVLPNHYSIRVYSLLSISAVPAIVTHL